jgi:hypothetical protein
VAGKRRKRTWMLLPLVNEERPWNDAIPREEEMVSVPLKGHETAESVPQLQHAAICTCVKGQKLPRSTRT